MDMIYVDSSNVDQLGVARYTNEIQMIFAAGTLHIFEGSLDVWQRCRDGFVDGHIDRS